jgi:hypothetical protein
MTIDPQKASDTRTWLVKALRDLMTAEQLFAFENPLLDSVVYSSPSSFGHAQIGQVRPAMALEHQTERWAAPDRFTNQVGSLYHCHQAAEKALM